MAASIVSTRIFLSIPFSLATWSRMLPRLVSEGGEAAIVAMFRLRPVPRSGVAARLSALARPARRLTLVAAAGGRSFVVLLFARRAVTFLGLRRQLEHEARLRHRGVWHLDALLVDPN